jgi:hypothetical protein
VAGKSKDRPQSRPATSPQDRENQLVALATDLAEEQMREGTASAQVISHYLKLGSTREQLEQERLRYETKLLEARTQQISDAARMEELYANAINAMKTYQGQEVPDEFDYGYED